MELARGMRVKVRTDHGGEFTGVVVQVNMNDGKPTWADILPDSRDIRGFLGNVVYELGSAHWEHDVTIL